MIPISELAEAYMSYYRSPNEELFWAYEQVDTLTEVAESGLNVCVALVEASRSKEELAYVAAGPLEDFVNRMGLVAIEAFEAPARQSSKFREAISGVWISQTSPIYPEWQKRFGKYTEHGKL